jgi:4,5-DOPA dioxygenase extradiol
MNLRSAPSGGQMNTLPTIFISHGSPTLLKEALPAHHFLLGLGRKLPRPDAILCVSAHWEATAPMVNLPANPITLYDFCSYPSEFYQVTYPAPGSPALAQRVTKLLVKAGFDATTHPGRGLDHGAWVPLKLMFPQANIPVIQLSVQSRLSAAHHLALGRVLQPLRDEGVLIMGSGAATHNLPAFHGQLLGAPVQDYVQAFDDWLYENITQGKTEKLVDYLNQAPFAQRNHPSPEHYLPLLVPLGAAGEGACGRRIHCEIDYGIFSMASYIWEG